jgi:hypothetical protein
MEFVVEKTVWVQLQNGWVDGGNACLGECFRMWLHQLSNWVDVVSGWINGMLANVWVVEVHEWLKKQLSEVNE